eukprot:Ihof_evm1s842 gene=Ihof_evmTU1s842
MKKVMNVKDIMIVKERERKNKRKEDIDLNRRKYSYLTIIYGHLACIEKHRNGGEKETTSLNPMVQSGEIERVFKRVVEGVMEFEDIWEKVHSSTNTSQKDKFESDLKKEIKKLQRLRDQIKTWQASNDIKDKSELIRNRKLIELQMEKFKVVERETKTKTFSKEGLSMAARMDPNERIKTEVRDWINSCTDRLTIQVDQFEVEIEMLLAKKKKSRKEEERLQHLEASILKHRNHEQKLERLLHMIYSESIDAAEVKLIEEDLEYYLDNNQEVDFQENEFIYDDLGVDFDALEETEESEEDDQASDEQKEEKRKNKGEVEGWVGCDMVNKVDSIRKTSLTKANTLKTATSTLATPSVLPDTTSTSTSIPRSTGSVTPQSSTTTTQIVQSSLSSTPQPVKSPPQSTTLQQLLAEAEKLLSMPVPQPMGGLQLPSQQPMTEGQVGMGQSEPSQGSFMFLSESPMQQGGSTTNPPSSSLGSNQQTVFTGQTPTPGPPASQSDDQQNKNPDFQLEFMGGEASTIGSANPIGDGMDSTLQILQKSMQNIPEQSDSERPKIYNPRNPAPTPPTYPTVPMPVFEQSSVYEKFDADTLFFIFYYNPGTYQQYLAARELKRQSWRFHKKYLTWFQRHEEPKIIMEDFEE